MRFPRLPAPCFRLVMASVFATLGGLNSLPVRAAEVATIDFSRDIRPILSDNCFACHGPDQDQRKAKLRLDTKEDAFKAAKSGEFAIVPGDPAKSSLLKRVTATDPDEIMPPPKSGKTLTPRQIDLLKTWIASGAKWQGHWAFDPPQRPNVPSVSDANWPRNEIDNFIQARL